MNFKMHFKQVFIPLTAILIFSLSSCEEKESCGRCDMEADPGLCTAAIVKYYYDQEEGECKSFTWGGCGDFPFDTLEECKECGCD